MVYFHALIFPLKGSVDSFRKHNPGMQGMARLSVRYRDATQRMGYGA